MVYIYNDSNVIDSIYAIVFIQFVFILYIEASSHTVPDIILECKSWDPFCYCALSLFIVIIHCHGLIVTT